MEQNEIKETGELERMINDYVVKAMSENAYELVFKEDGFDHQGYMAAEMMMGGVTFRCAINQEGYICWFSAEIIGRMIENVEGAKDLIVQKAVEHDRKHKIEFNEMRLRQIQEELEQLKKGENGKE